MHGSEYKFTEGARVRLRANVDPAIYGDYACTGNEAIVGHRRKDRFGLPEVYVQWDKNHWAYNGVSDCWTFEDHFEIVEDMMASKQEKVQELLAMLGSLLTESEPTNDQTSEAKPVARLRSRLLDAVQPFEPPADDAFAQAVEAGSQKLHDSEAFIIIGLDHHDHPNAPQGILEPYAMGYSKTPEGDILLTAHMARVAANAHQNLALEMVTQMADES